MAVEFDFERMEELLKSFFCISGVRYSLLDQSGKIVCASSELAPFCKRMNEDPEGNARCVGCDAAAIARAARLKEPYLFYTCHAGLNEAVIPVRQHGEVLAYVIFGQTAEAGDAQAQWKRTRVAIDWMDNADEMKEAFFALRRTDAALAESCAKILHACSSYIWMEGMIRSESMTDEQLLCAYIDAHYQERLTLDGVAKALSMSKTKLCGVAARQGTTVMSLLNAKRMEEAKRLLRGSASRVSEVAERVGVSDYNYFTKLFFAHTGETPRAYQQRHRAARSK